MKKDYFSQPSPALALHRSMFILQQKAENMLMDQTGISLSHMRIMSQLHISVARSQKTVASMLHQTEANVSRQIHAMQKAGLVKVSRHKDDRRVRQVVLTAKGGRLYQKGEKVLNSQYNSLAKMLGKAEAASFQKAADVL